jgi:hypothetical protein
MGTRVRVVAPEALPSRFTGRATGIQGDTLLLMKENEDLIVPLATVQLLEISRGRDRVRGPTYGMGIGAVVIGTLFAATNSNPSPCDYVCLTVPQAFALGAVLGIIPGTVVGALIGKERWERIPLRL